MIIRRCLSVILTVASVAFVAHAPAQVSNLSVRIATANISSGPDQAYEQAGRDILKGLKPDIVAIQEFKASALPAGTNDTNMRALVDECFGTNFSYFKQTKAGYSIPNGIISRWPIIASGSWDDTAVPTITDRSFAWAQIDLPGTNDLYVVSVHLYSSGSSTDRNNEATVVRSNILANFPAGAWVIVGGDFNTANRSEPCVATFKTFLSDYPIPTDQAGNPDTNAGRGSPYDYILPSFNLTNYLDDLVLPSHTFTNGLVADTRVYTPISDLSPALATNSGAFQMQHMAVVKQLQLPVFGTNAATAPSIVTQPQSRTNLVGTSANFFIAATGTAPLAYQWQLNGTNLASSINTNHSIASVQLTDAGSYRCIVTNPSGSSTSAVAVLTVTSNSAPNIVTDPVAQTNLVGTAANFFVAVTGTAPLTYQWRFNGTNIAGATSTNFAIVSVQTTNAGGYSCVVTNTAGSTTSSVASLTVILSNAPPSISTQPVSQTNVAGTTINFSVVAAGTAPLSYQWRFNGTNVSGSATNSTYSILNAQTNHSGPYTVVVTNIAGSVTSSVANLSITPASTNSFTGVLAGWDVSGQTNFGPSPMAPTTNAANLTIVGLTRGAGVPITNTAAARTWGGVGFDAANATAAVVSNDFATITITADSGFQVSYSSISRFDYRRSSSGPANGVLQYQVGAGAFTDITSLSYPINTSAGGSIAAIDLSGITALQNVAPGTNVTFRIVNYGGGASATWYIWDIGNSTAPDFAVSGSITAVPPPSGPPAAAPALSTPLLSSNLIVFQLTGTTASNYVVQTTTNLAAPFWTPLFTNAAPFLFTNPVNGQQQYFRGLIAP